MQLPLVPPMNDVPRALKPPCALGVEASHECCAYFCTAVGPGPLGQVGSSVNGCGVPEQKRPTQLWCIPASKRLIKLPGLTGTFVTASAAYCILVMRPAMHRRLVDCCIHTFTQYWHLAGKCGSPSNVRGGAACWAAPGMSALESAAAKHHAWQ